MLRPVLSVRDGAVVDGSGQRVILRGYNIGGDYHLTKTEQHSVTTNRTILNVLRQQARVRIEEPAPPPMAPPPVVNTSRLIGRKK